VSTEKQLVSPGIACDFDWECRGAKAKCSAEDCERKLMKFALAFQFISFHFSSFQLEGDTLFYSS